MRCGPPCSAASGSSCAGSGSSRSSHESAASAATLARARKCASRRAGPSGSSPVKICRISGNLDPALFDPHFPPRLPEAGTDGVLTPPYVWQPRPQFQNRVWLHVTLFALTVGTTWLVQGWAYSVTILSILGCHELGH